MPSLNAVNIPRAMTNFRPERFNDFHTATVKFFADREPHSLTKLKKLKCPVKLIQCGGDIAYPVHFAEELLQRLLDAGAEADLEVVEDAPHYGTVTHPHEINPLVHDYIMSHTSHPVPPPLDEVISPFEAELLATGWTPNGSEDEDSDDEFEICYKFETSL
ncbi:hypothetical protein H0H81_002623 [Sphagnurus paluster]|uniref:Uncharacterized protein n=1 Tax=Sphagnurus paluster TaxID=117069 RepID=A0A9P7KLQ6_9AGAR|nr:hypothetical protein H0H81_002623 [Sphagnurus paluster]